MAQIHNYQNEALTFGDDDFYDIDFYTGSGYETKKIKGSTIKTAIANSVPAPNVKTLYSDDDSLASDRIVKGSAGTHFLQLSEMAHFHVDTQGSKTDCVKFTVPTGETFASFIIANSAKGSPMFAVENGYVVINDEYRLPLLDGSAGQILSTDGAGLAKWIDAPQSGVTSVNTFQGAITIQGSGNTTVTSPQSGVIDISSSGGTIGNTIYSSDDVLVNNRRVSGNSKNNFSLTFEDLGFFNVVIPSVSESQPNAVTFIVPTLEKVFQFLIASAKPLFAVKANRVIINDAYALPNTVGNNGDVITSDGSGGSDWTTPSSGGGATNSIESTNAGDVDLYNDQIVRIWLDDGSSDDIELEITNFGSNKSSTYHVSYTNFDGSSTTTNIVDLNEDGATSISTLDFDFGTDEIMKLRIWSPRLGLGAGNGNGFPFYEVTIIKSSSLYTGFPVLTSVIKSTS